MRHTRVVTRHPFTLTATLHPVKGGVGAGVTVLDISTLGCQLEHARGPKIGKKCELYFDWRGRSVGLEAKVVWSDDRGRVGLKYEKIDEHSEGCLRELCASLQAQALTGRRVEAVHAAPGSTKTLGAEHPMFRPVAPPPAKTDSEGLRRTLPRYISEMRGDVVNSATGTSAGVSLIDLSVSGARLEGAGLPDAGQACQLQTEWEGRQIVLRGEVAWKSRKQIGLKFSSLDEETARQLRQICANLHIAPPGPRD
ncbi:MAG TPA: PilZ domain-containing protein [Terriglobia bacterium]|nr:PilZ domain-containing protein [Terriglobia bacterium]